MLEILIDSKINLSKVVICGRNAQDGHMFFV